MWACPHAVVVLKLKSADPRGISSSSVIILIAVHSPTILAWGSQGITSENHHQSSLCKVYGDKSDDTSSLDLHAILSYWGYVVRLFILFFYT